MCAHTHPCHSKTHNTYIKLQNRKKKKSSLQNFANFLFRNSQISDHHDPPHPFPLHSWYIAPSIHAGKHYSTAHKVQEKHLFPPGVIISGNLWSGEIQSQPWPQLSTQYSCFLSSSSRCPCHAIMRNSVQTSPHKRGVHKRRFKEAEKVSKRLFSVSDYKVSWDCDCVSCTSTTSSVRRANQIPFLDLIVTATKAS